jgi:hypothetical protein
MKSFMKQDGGRERSWDTFHRDHQIVVCPHGFNGGFEWIGSLAGAIEQQSERHGRHCELTDAKKRADKFVRSTVPQASPSLLTQMRSGKDKAINIRSWLSPSRPSKSDCRWRIRTRLRIYLRPFGRPWPS